MAEGATLGTGGTYKWLAFSAMALGMFVTVMDFGGVGVALPTIADELGLELATASWVLISAALTISAVLLPAGGLSDILGRKRSYLAGIGLYALGMLAAGLAPDLIPLVLARVVGALGSAMMMANGMAIVMTVFPASERGKAMGMITTSVGLAAITGPIVGGGMVEVLGWRSFFFLLAGGALLAGAWSARVLDEDRISVHHGGRLLAYDWVGTALSAGALTLLILVLTMGNKIGWGSGWMVGGGGLTAAMFALFICWELHSDAPMFNLRTFSNSRFSWPVATRFLGFFGGSAWFFLMPFYLQDVLGYAPSHVGLITFPGALGFALIGAFSGRYSDRFGVKPFTVTGLTLAIIGGLMLASLDANSSLFVIMPALMLSGVGMGLWVAPNMSAVVASVERSAYGVVSAFLNLVRNTANVTAVAGTTAIVVGTMAARGFEADLSAVSEGRAPGVADAFVTGARYAYLSLAGVAAVGLVAALKAPDPVRSEANEPVTVVERAQRTPPAGTNQSSGAGTGERRDGQARR